MMYDSLMKTALDILRELVNDTPNPYDTACYFCGDTRGGDNDHEPDCVWVAARKFVIDADATDKHMPKHMIPIVQA